MAYWAILLAKFAVAGPVLYGIWFVLHALYPLPEHITRWGHSPFMHDLTWTTIMFVFNLFCYGVLFLIVWDQKYRCRTCGRRLRMPISTGRYAQILLFGAPKTEYICIYGHGTLKVPELHITGREAPNWESHGDDIWKELEQYDREKK